MTKQEFIAQLRKKLSGLPEKDIEERIMFYSEMIDDGIEEGLTEDEAVYKIGSLDEIKTQITEDIPLYEVINKKIKAKRKLESWEIVLLILGSPIWLSLIIASFSVILSLYAVLWSLIISVWAVFVSVAACSLLTIIGAVIIAVSNITTGIAMIGVGLVCAGISIFLFFASKSATKGGVKLTIKISGCIKKAFVKKEAVL